jgi:hypothetical protein
VPLDATLEIVILALFVTLAMSNGSARQSNGLTRRDSRRVDDDVGARRADRQARSDHRAAAIAQFRKRRRAGSRSRRVNRNETVPVAELRVKVTRTPVAPDSAEVPMTSEPAEAVPVEAAAVLLDTRSATSCIRLFLRVVE